MQDTQLPNTSETTSKAVSIKSTKRSWAQKRLKVNHGRGAAVRRGKILARQTGKEFEKHLEKEFNLIGAGLLKIPEGFRFTKGGITPVKSPFDFVGYRRVSSEVSKAIFFDAKTTKEKNFPRPKIKPHQVKELARLEGQGFLAGYLIRFADENELYFFKASLLRERMNVYGSGLGRELGTHIRKVEDLFEL